MTLKQAWEDSISPQLLPRLLRPILQPGVIDTQIARKIIQRSQNLANRLPLLTQVQKNWCKVSNLDVGQVPIVYAQPRTNANNEIFNTSNQENSSRQANEKPRMVIQAKFAPGKNSQKTPLSNSNFNSKQAVSLNSNALNTPLNRVVGINATEATDGISSTKGSLLNKETIKPGLSLEHKHNKEQNQEKNQEKNQEQFRNLNFGSVAVTRETSSIDSNSTLPLRDIINHAPAGQLPLVQAKFAPSKSLSTEQASTIKLDSINHNTVSNSITLEPRLSQNQPQTSQITKEENSGAEFVYNQAQTSPLREINSRLIDIQKQPIPLVYHRSEPLISDTVSNFVTGNSQVAVIKPVVKPRPTTPSQKISSNGKLETMPINLGNNKYKMPFYQPSLAAKDLATTKAEAERASQNMVNKNNQGINHNLISQQQPIRIVESPQITNNTTEKNNIDVDALVDKVEQKIMRKLIVENERRGQGQWR
jgi:hypothetical protein